MELNRIQPVMYAPPFYFNHQNMVFKNETKSFAWIISVCGQYRITVRFCNNESVQINQIHDREYIIATELLNVDSPLYIKFECTNSMDLVSQEIRPQITIDMNGKIL